MISGEKILEIHYLGITSNKRARQLVADNKAAILLDANVPELSFKDALKKASEEAAALLTPIDPKQK